MPELKKIRVRDAKSRDVGLFRKLWAKYLKEQHKHGSLIIPDDHNLNVGVNLFNLYVGKELDGSVLFVSDVAVMMWGDMGSPYHLSVGDRVAYGWGIYVEPEHRGRGIGDALHKGTVERLGAMGFEALIGNLMDGDEHAETSLRRGVAPLEVKWTGERPLYIMFKE